MIYIINNTGKKTTITTYEHKETKYILMYSPYKNTIAFKYIPEEEAIKIMLKEKLSKLPFNQQVKMNMEFHQNKLYKKEYALSGWRKTRNENAIDFIQRNIESKNAAI